jgi:anthranilate phosphoribosyltransferase
MASDFRQLFGRITERKDLTVEESRQAAFAMMEGSWESPQSAAFLTALHMKGETPEEVAGFGLAMRERAVTPPEAGKHTLDTCGTGGDRKCSFNISTVAAFVLAGCGIPVAKHGNGAVSSEAGSADLLAALGIRHRLLPDEIPESLEKAGFAFLFAPDYHPATRSVADVRRMLGCPTLFNLLGPLTNPVRPAARLIGVYDRNALPVVAGAVRIMDAGRRVTLVHGLDGWDEATPCCDFLLYPLQGGVSRRKAAEFGFRSCTAADLTGGNAQENAAAAVSILQGERGPRRDAVLLNAMLAVMVYHPNLRHTEALAMVTESVDSGSAQDVVTRLRGAFPAEAS